MSLSKTRPLNVIAQFDVSQDILVKDDGDERPTLRRMTQRYIFVTVGEIGHPEKKFLGFPRRLSRSVPRDYTDAFSNSYMRSHRTRDVMQTFNAETSSAQFCQLCDQRAEISSKATVYWKRRNE